MLYDNLPILILCQPLVLGKYQGILLKDVCIMQ